VQSVLGSFTERHLFVLGVIFILFVRFLPGGLFGLLRGASVRERAP
jgi:ABC-type branched-subunit amino acid transport system permease subunit